MYIHFREWNRLFCCSLEIITNTLSDPPKPISGILNWQSDCTKGAQIPMELTESVVMSHNPLYHSGAHWICRIMVSPIYKRIEVRIDIRPSCSLLVIMHFFSWLHKCDLKIQLHRRDLYQSLAVCGRHVFTMRCLLEKMKLWHFMENKLPYAHLRYIFNIFSLQHGPLWWCLISVKSLVSFSAKCTTKVLQRSRPTRIPCHHRNSLYTHRIRILPALTAWYRGYNLQTHDLHGVNFINRD